jgi:hypothetical protein
MSSNVRLRALLIVIASLIVIWFIGDHYGMRAKDRTYRDVVLAVDTARITAIEMRPGRRGREPWRIVRGDTAWRLEAQSDSLRVPREAMLELLGPLASLRVKRQVGTMDLVKDRYELSDTNAERLTIRFGDGSAKELLVGRSTFSPKGAWSHVNVPGEQEVFAVEGVLSMATEKSVEEWRPLTVVAGDPANWRRITFNFGGGAYAFDRDATGAWKVEAMPGDSSASDTARIRKFISSMSVSKAHRAAKDVRIDGLLESHHLEIVDVKRSAPIVVSLYAVPDGRFLLHSSCNPDNLLWFDPEREVPRLFRPRGNWFVGVTPTGPGS